jgi:hypothetical protein
MPEPRARFPVLRWFGVVFLAVLVPCYWKTYGWGNFLQLCDVALGITVLGWWLGSSLLLSTQTVSCLVIHVLWCVDFGTALATGRHPIGGTEYMWSEGRPLFVRLLSLFHVAWVPLLLCSLRKTGYHRRSLPAQSAFALAVMFATLVLGPVLSPGQNINYVFGDPFRNKVVGPAAVHVLLTWAVLVAAVYVPTDLALRRAFRDPKA